MNAAYNNNYGENTEWMSRYWLPYISMKEMADGMTQAATGTKGYSHPFKHANRIMLISSRRHHCQ